MNATKILSDLSEAEIQARLTELEAEQRAARVLLRAVKNRDRTLRCDRAEPPQDSGEAAGGAS
jgi:hypothetical protein